MKTSAFCCYFCSFLFLFQTITAQTNLSPYSTIGIENSSLSKQDDNINFFGKANFQIYDVFLAHENDIFGRVAGNINKDESYTGGFQLSISTSPVLKNLFLRFNQSSDDQFYVHDYSRFELGAVAFTPFDIESTEIVEEDRPYASFHYGGIGYSSRLLGCKRNHTPMDQRLNSQFYVGIIGGYAAPVFQSFTHRRPSPRETPNGWHNQIGGGKRSIAINHRLTYEFLLFQAGVSCCKKEFKREKPLKIWRWFSFYPIFEWNIGTFQDNLGLGARINLVEVNRGVRYKCKTGKCKSNCEAKGKTYCVPEFDQWKKNAWDQYRNPSGIPPSPPLSLPPDTGFDNLEKLVDSLGLIENVDFVLKDSIFFFSSDVLSSQVAPPVDDSEKINLNNCFSMNLYIQGIGRAVFFNAMLQGTFFNDKSVHTIDYRQMNPFILDLVTGVALKFKGFNLYVDGSYLSQEFLGGKRWHIYGRAGIAFVLN